MESIGIDHVPLAYSSPISSHLFFWGEAGRVSEKFSCSYSQCPLCHFGWERVMETTLFPRQCPRAIFCVWGGSFCVSSPIVFVMVKSACIASLGGKKFVAINYSEKRTLRACVSCSNEAGLG